jgi:hypothetical protein
MREPKIYDVEPYLSGQTKMALAFWRGHLAVEDREFGMWSSPWDVAYGLSSVGEQDAANEVLAVTEHFRERQREYA